MAVPEALLAEPGVTGPLGSLALSSVRPRAAELGLRALKWQRDLERLGVHMPLFVVHDVGLLLACENSELEFGPRAAVEGRAQALLPRYARLIEQVAESEAARRSRTLKMSDDLTVVLLTRLFSSVTRNLRATAPYASGVPLDAALFEQLDAQLPALFEAVNRSDDLAALEALLGAELYVLTVVDALDLDTLQLFGMVGRDSAEGALAQVDLLSVLGSPEANDVVDFSLEILPSVLEAKRRPGASSHAAFGYAGLARKGSLDNLVLTELAWDETELWRRLADDEVLYYAREQARDEARRVHHFLIDASASMRGERATFARGTAIASAKKLLLAREDVVFRFFDSRLYEAHPARAGRLPTGYLLSFKGEHGRNPARVFRELASVLDVVHDARDVVVHLFTHAALYIPRELVAKITACARMAAVFMLPSGGALDLDYLDLLDAHWVVDHDVLSSRHARAREARRILAQDDGSRSRAESGPTSAEIVRGD
jgi:hypothetical protein